MKIGTNEALTNVFKRVSLLTLVACVLSGCVGAAAAQSPVPARDSAQNVAAPADVAEPTYADLATLAERASLVVHARIRDQIALDPERAPDVAPGFARLYIEADTIALIAGSVPVGEDLTYLVDVPARSNGKAPMIAGLEFLLFADPVAGRAGSIQLVGPAAQIRHSDATEARLRAILTELVAADAPPVVTGISDAFAVPGTLTGESETQIFLQTADGSPVSLTILRRPGQPPVWGASWGEIIDSTARPPARDTLRWYRLACSLPDRLPSDANLGGAPAARALAERDYAYLRKEIGTCARAVTQGY